MFPFLWQGNLLAIPTYTFLFGVACVLGLIFWAFLGVRKGLPFESLISTGLGAIFFGWIGARALFLITNIERVDFSKIDFIWSGGIVFYGGFLGGGAFLLWSLRRKQIPLFEALNCGAPAFVLAHSVGRLGCFANGCCYGKPTFFPWGVTYSDPYSAARPLGVSLHPVQLYEAGFLLVLFLILMIWELYNFGKNRGFFSTLRIYLISYPLFRFTIEFFRADQQRGELWGFSTSQIVSFGVLIFALLLDLSPKRDHNLTP